jgi:hypothetical protein
MAIGAFKLDAATCSQCPAGGTTLDIATNTQAGCVSDLGHQGPAGGPFTPCPIASYSGIAIYALLNVRKTFAHVLYL